MKCEEIKQRETSLKEIEVRYNNIDFLMNDSLSEAIKCYKTLDLMYNGLLDKLKIELASNVIIKANTLSFINESVSKIEEYKNSLKSYSEMKVISSVDIANIHKLSVDILQEYSIFMKFATETIINLLNK